MVNVVKMHAFSKTRAKWVDPVLWVVVFAVCIASFWANYHWPALSGYIKAAIWLVTAIVAFAIVGLTEKGLAFLKFTKEARVELKKVHWPTRQETVQTTLMVVVMVVVVGLFLWGVDAFFMWGINKLTGQ